MKFAGAVFVCRRKKGNKSFFSASGSDSELHLRFAQFTVDDKTKGLGVEFALRG